MRTESNSHRSMISTGSSISVVIPTHNREKYIARAIDSVINQSSQVDEIIVVDDGSTDRTAEIVREHAGRVRLIQIENNNSGPSRPRNVGIQAATSAYITLLDSDDYFQPTLIEKHRKLLTLFPQVGLVGSNCFRQIAGDKHLDLNEANVIRGCKKQVEENGFYRVSPEKAYASLCSGNYLTSCTGATFPKSVWEKVGGFNENLPTSNDYEFFIRVLRHHDLGYVDEPLFVYFHHNENISAANRTKRFKPELQQNHIRVLRQELEWTESSGNRRSLQNGIQSNLLELAYGYRVDGQFRNSLKTYLRTIKEGGNVSPVLYGLLKLPVLYWRDRLRAT